MEQTRAAQRPATRDPSRATDASASSSSSDARLGRPAPVGTVVVRDVRPGDTVSAWLARHGGFDRDRFCQLLGAANPFKEGDHAQGLAAADEASRANARALLAATPLAEFLAAPIFEDELSAYVATAVDHAARAPIAHLTLGGIVDWLLARPEAEIRAVMPGLPSDLIGVLPRLMTDDQLVALSRKVFNPLPGSQVGAAGYLGARIQPNSPTDDPEDILFQVLSGFSYAVGDLVLGTNPVSGTPEAVLRVEQALADVIDAFGLADVLRHCVLTHVDLQAQVEEAHPGSTALWFQSLAGVADANRVFDIDVAKMRAHAAKRTGPYALYFETGQGADGTNGHGKGFDMVLHESRKYGFARALKRDVASARAAAGVPGEPWVHVNDVAGFIGPEVFRTREQLVRVCLEDTVMGKLHGLCHGLDICSTLHMDVTLDDLTWCQDQVAPANPGYLMALPTRNDPMLSYLTTSFQDHVRLRERHGYKVDDRMWAFFQRLGVIDADGRPTARFGDPAWVYLQYRRAKGDARPDRAVLAEAEQRLARVRSRGVLVPEGHGEHPWDMDPEVDATVRRLYEDARRCLFSELPADFAARLGPVVELATRATDRDDYILHPPHGESLDDASESALRAMADARAGRYDLQLVVDDGLDALALADEDHLEPFLATLRPALAAAGWAVAPETLLVRLGRVRAGYRAGELLFGGPAAPARGAVLHVIGERPGNGHHTYSVYLTAADQAAWSTPGEVDHHLTRVVANVADSALQPEAAAAEVAAILGSA